VESPVRDPRALDAVVFREGTEDVYMGIEFAAGSEGAARLEGLLGELGYALPPGSGIGVKPISRRGTRRIVRAAVEYALAHGRRRLTIVHKGNIMKYTEGAFLAWGLELVREEYADRAVIDAGPSHGPPPRGKLLVGERIADAMFQDLLLRPGSVDVIVAPNLNGDYLSDACAARVGGLGIAPGANLGDGVALFEATHGTAPDIAGRNVANPGSMILSGAMLLDHLGWHEASALVVRSFAAVLASGRVTQDLVAGRTGIEVLGTDAFGRAVARAVETEAGA
jgi:isocitrate dehydrogenase